MSRVYIQSSWVGAAEDWSGDSPDNRKCSSRELYLPNGKANTKAFADEAPKPKAKKKSVADSIDLAEKHFQRMEKLSEELDEEYYAGEIDDERYELLRYKLDKRLLAAWSRLEKENKEIWDRQDARFELTALDKKINNTVKFKNYDKDDSIFSNLSDSNVFKIMYYRYKEIISVFKDW